VFGFERRCALLYVGLRCQGQTMQQHCCQVVFCSARCYCCKECTAEGSSLGGLYQVMCSVSWHTSSMRHNTSATETQSSNHLLHASAAAPSCAQSSSWLLLLHATAAVSSQMYSTAAASRCMQSSLTAAHTRRTPASMCARLMPLPLLLVRRRSACRPPAGLTQSLL
jgi:hypothetical protein